MLHAYDLHRWWDALCADALFALRGRHDQHGDVTGLKDREREIDITACGDDHVQWGLWLPQARPKPLVRLGERWIDVRGSPAVMGNGP